MFDTEPLSLLHEVSLTQCSFWGEGCRRGCHSAEDFNMIVRDLLRRCLGVSAIDRGSDSSQPVVDTDEEAGFSL